MKNTAKKILALVFAVAMICTLAVPAFATGATNDITVNVKIVAPVKTGDTYAYNSDSYTAVSVSVAEEAKLHDVMTKLSAYVIYNATQLVTGLTGETEYNTALKDVKTGAWVIAVNGKSVTATKNCVMQDGDNVVIYWADSAVETKLVLADYEKLLSGVVAFYYNDAEGNRVPVKGLNVTINGGAITDKLDSTPAYFTTDEAGQIWIAPADLQALDMNEGSVVDFAGYSEGDVKYYPVATYDVKEISDDYSKELAAHFVAFGACNIVTAPVFDAVEFESGEYDRPSTGDMTMVYVLVAAAAVVTLGAVVVMKKKAVKAN